MVFNCTSHYQLTLQSRYKLKRTSSPLATINQVVGLIDVDCLFKTIRKRQSFCILVPLVNFGEQELMKTQL
jgi:hypothetical protein